MLESISTMDFVQIKSQGTTQTVGSHVLPCGNQIRSCGEEISPVTSFIHSIKSLLSEWAMPSEFNKFTDTYIIPIPVLPM